MKPLTLKRRLELYKYNIVLGFPKPKYYLGDVVYVQDFNYGSGVVDEVCEDGQWRSDFTKPWTWMDKCRSERIGQPGHIVRMERHNHRTRPYQVSIWSYFVKFADGHEISFCEEQLIATKPINPDVPMSLAEFAKKEFGITLSESDLALAKKLMPIIRGYGKGCR